MEKIIDLTKSYLPTISAIGLVCGLATVIWFSAVYTTRLEILEARVESLENKIATMPTRNEFDDLKKALDSFQSETRLSFNEIMKYLRK